MWFLLLFLSYIRYDVLDVNKYTCPEGNLVSPLLLATMCPIVGNVNNYENILMANIIAVQLILQCSN